MIVQRNKLPEVVILSKNVNIFKAKYEKHINNTMDTGQGQHPMSILLSVLEMENLGVKLHPVAINNPLFFDIFHNFPLLSQTGAEFHICIVSTNANHDSNLQLYDQIYLTTRKKEHLCIFYLFHIFI